MYWDHSIRFAGLGLALLYMTVLGFGSVTYGYILMQGISEGMLGALTSLSAFIGVLGSISYPFLR